jgi:hypothetical protein
MNPPNSHFRGGMLEFQFMAATNDQNYHFFALREISPELVNKLLADCSRITSQSLHPIQPS